MTERISLDGKVAVVTGAGRGLGRAYVELLAEHTEPHEKCRLVQCEAGVWQPLAQILAFEIDRYKDERSGKRDAFLVQPLAFPRLCCRMIDLEHAQFGIRIAQGKRVEACAKDHGLTYTARHRRGQRVLRKAASRREEEAQRRAVGIGRAFVRPRATLVTQNAAGKRIAENGATLDRLMRCAMTCRTARG